MGSERKDKLVRYRSPAERRARRRAHLRIAALLTLGFLLLTPFDPFLARLLFNEDRAPVQNTELYRLFRVVGTLWCWFLLTIILRLHDRVWDRAGSLFFAPLLAGLTAETLKLVIARERPTAQVGVLREGWYSFRGLFAGFQEGANLALPSSHAAVAFAGCLCLAAWMPHARWALIAVALACGLTRMLIGAHYATDIYLGAVIGWLWARFFEPLEPPRRYA